MKGLCHICFATNQILTLCNGQPKWYLPLECMIYDWEAFIKTQRPLSIKGMKITSLKIIIDNKVVKESYIIKDVTDA